MGSVAAALDRYGIELFVAHEDIEPDREWKDEILNALGTTDGSVAFLHQEFKTSDWCGQEVGWHLRPDRHRVAGLRGVHALAVRADELRPVRRTAHPAAYYTGTRAACQTQDLPLAATPDLGARFTFVTPNLCNDMHSCPVASGDRWLAGFVPKVLASPQYQGGDTVLVITWDERDVGAGNPVAPIVVAPSVAPGTRSATPYTHYSLLRTTEELLGLPLLGAAATATSMRPGFGL